MTRNNPREGEPMPYILEHERCLTKSRKEHKASTSTSSLVIEHHYSIGSSFESNVETIIESEPSRDMEQNNEEEKFERQEEEQEEAGHGGG